MKIFSVFLLLSIYCVPVQSWAINKGKIEAMQMPAWIKHENGQRQALTPGMLVQSGDELITGKASRILIRLREGSFIKLGQDAQLAFNRPQVQQVQGVYQALISVVKGAFRFTTTALSKNRKRDINIKLGAITVGIRGTDIWGKSNSKEDLLALIEGSVQVQKGGAPAFTMQDALSYLLIPSNQVAEPMNTISKDQLVQWAAETELFEWGGVLTIGGKWNVNLISLSSLEATVPVLKSLDDSGFAAHVEKFISLGHDWYRIRIKGFKTVEEAKIFARNIDGSHGVRRPWVSKS